MLDFPGGSVVKNLLANAGTDQFFIRDVKKEISSLTGKTSLVFCKCL